MVSTVARLSTGFHVAPHSRLVSTVAFRREEVSTSTCRSRVVSTSTRSPTGFDVKPCLQVSTVARSGARGNQFRFLRPSGYRGNLCHFSDRFPRSTFGPFSMSRFPRSPEGRPWKHLTGFHGIPINRIHRFPRPPGFHGRPFDPGKGEMVSTYARLAMFPR